VFLIIRALRASVIGLAKLTWWFLKALYNLPRTLPAIWSEIRHGVKRCSVCEADLSGWDVCDICGTDQNSPDIDDRRKRLSEKVTIPAPRLQLKFYDLARRVSLAAASAAILISFLLMSIVNLVMIGELEPLSILATILLGIWVTLLLSAPAVYYMGKRWLLPFSPKLAGAWTVVSLVLLFGVNSSFFGGFWLGTILAILMLTPIALVWFQLSFRLILKNQRQRWEQFFSVSAIDVGYSGRPGASLSIAGLDKTNVSIGQQGEQLTADSVRGSIEKKSILFNSLVHPNYKFLGDLDHALLLGSSLLLIDTKRWRAGRYSGSQGNVLRDGEVFDGGNISLGKWVQIMRDDMGSKVSVEGYVVMTNPASIVGGDGRLGSDVSLVTLEHFQELIEEKSASNTSLPPARAIEFLSTLVSDSGGGFEARYFSLSDLDEAILG
jgi:hypothetical protein